MKCNACYDIKPCLKDFLKMDVKIKRKKKYQCSKCKQIYYINHDYIAPMMLIIMFVFQKYIRLFVFNATNFICERLKLNQIFVLITIIFLFCFIIFIVHAILCWKFMQFKKL